MKIKNLGFLLIFISTLSYSESASKGKLDAGLVSARNVIERLIGKRIRDCEFIIKENSEKGDFYEYSVTEGVLTVTGNSGVSICKGAYDYLQSIGSVQAAWQQNAVKLPKTFSNCKLTRVDSPNELRLFLNVCQYGYTSPWWQWEDWEKMLDWIVLHGYNSMPAMVGQEIIWHELFTEMGVSEKEMGAYFAGAAYLPWQRMGNVAGVSGPLPKSYLIKQKEIQKKIIKRMLDLGMTPIVPGFSGFVPNGIKKLNPEVKIKEIGWKHEQKWTYLLDIQDDLFMKIGADFVKRYRETYGDVHYFLCDTFNENEVNVSSDPETRYEELANYGNTIYQSLKVADDKAVWVTQAWMFIADSDFWNAKNASALFSKIPNDKMLIVDYGNDREVIWDRLGAYDGKRWVYGYVHNYGGVTPLQGNLSLIATEQALLHKRDDVKGLSGFALCPEGSHTNYVVYAMAADASWSKESINVEKWLKSYSENRYGIKSANLSKAWNILEKNIYNVKYWHARGGEQGWGSFFYCKPPSNNINYDLTGNYKMIAPALDLFFIEKDELKDQPLYRRDALDFTRHFLESRIDHYIKEAIIALETDNVAAQDLAIVKVKNIMTDLDDLLSASPEHSLSDWLIKAKKYGVNKDEENQHIKTARQIVTIWGEGLNGYASKGCHVMIKDFYLQRWLLHFDNVRSGNPKKNDISLFETQWVNSASIPKIKKNINVVAECYRLFEKYSRGN